MSIFGSEEVEKLQSDIKRLRQVVSDVVKALDNGGFCSTDASVEFMEGVPKEVGLVVARLKKEQDGWKQTARAFLGDFALTHTPEECEAEVINRASVDAVRAEDRKRIDTAEQRVVALEAEVARHRTHRGEPAPTAAERALYATDRVTAVKAMRERTGVGLRVCHEALDPLRARGGALAKARAEGRAGAFKEAAAVALMIVDCSSGCAHAVADAIAALIPEGES